MNITFTEESKKDLADMDNSVYLEFRKHLKKIAIQPPRKHAKHGLPFFTENVGRNGRIPVLIAKDTIIVMRCFEHHKEYDKWLDQFK